MNRPAGVYVAVLLCVALIGTAGGMVKADNVQRMLKEELKELIGRSDVVILDVRTGWHWMQAEAKIKGAVRELPEGFESWSDKYERDKTIVLYCA